MKSRGSCSGNSPPKRACKLMYQRAESLLTDGVSSLQTKLSHRERHEARRVGLEAIPLDQHIEGGHGERQARLKIRPTPMHHLLQMANERQHREHRLYQQAVLPLTPRTQFEIARIPLRGMETGVAQ